MIATDHPEHVALANALTEVGTGWHALITAAYERIAQDRSNYAVVQVKEKFGTLRVYFDPVDRSNGELLSTVRLTINGADFIDPHAINGWRALQTDIAAIERESARYCEDCGTTDGVTTEPLSPTRYWIRTLCPACRVDHAKASSK